MKHIKQAYDDLRAGLVSSNIQSKQSIEERRDNADIIILQLLVYLLEQRNYDGFIKQFEAHFHAFKNSFDSIQSNIATSGVISGYLQKFEEQRWRGNWHNTIAMMLEQKPILFNDS